MIFESYIPSNTRQFIDKTYHIADKLGVYPEYLMAVMWFESKLNPRAQNSYSQATGLIQFMPSTATSLGTSISQLMSMSNVEQLDYVYQYLKPYAGRMQSLEDVYLAVFYPAAIGKPDYYAIGGHTVAQQNPIFDIDNDGQVTKGEVLQKLLNSFPSAEAEILKKKGGNK